MNVKKLVLSIVMVLFTSVLLLTACTASEIAEDKVSQSSAESSEPTPAPTTAPTLEPTPTPKPIAEEKKLENGLIIVKYDDETYGVLNDKGENLYEDLTGTKDLENGFVAVERGELTGFTDGEINTEIKYNKYGSYSEGILAGDEEAKIMDILVKGEEIISQKGVYVDSRKGTDDIIYEIREKDGIQYVYRHIVFGEEPEDRSMPSIWEEENLVFCNRDINDITLFCYVKGRKNIEGDEELNEITGREYLYNPATFGFRSATQVFMKIYEDEEDIIGSYGYIAYLAYRDLAGKYHETYRLSNDDCTYVRGEDYSYPQWEDAVFTMNQEQGTSFDYTPKIVFDYETEEFVEITEENKHLLASEQMKSLINE